MYAERLPPFSEEAEEAVLGSVLIEQKVWPVIQPLLKPAHFYRERNRYVFEAMERCFEDSQAINEVTVARALDKAEKLDEVGGMAYLAHLVTVVPTPLHAGEFARIVKECGDRRRRIELAGGIAGAAYDEQDDSEYVEELLSMSIGVASRGFKSLREISDETFNDFEEWLETGAKPRGLLTGLDPIDKVLDGLGKGRVYIVAGRPSMGKSDFVMTLCQRIAERGGKPGYVSLEMPVADVLERMTFARAGLDRFEIMKRKEGPTEEEKQRLRDARAELDNLGVWLLDIPELRLRDIRAYAMSLKARLGGLDLLVVDHIGHIGDQPSEKQYERITAISRRLLAVARTLDIPLLVVAQLSRGVEMRPGKHIPQLADLRDSGHLEQDAFAVLFLWRWDYYRESEGKDPRSEFYQDDPKEHNVLRVFVSKVRGGPRAEIGLFYDTATGRIGNLSDKEES